MKLVAIISTLSALATAAATVSVSYDDEHDELQIRIRKVAPVMAALSRARTVVAR